MVDSMFHLRRIHFQSYVTAAAAAAAASCKPESKGKAAAKTPPSDQQQLEAINDKTEPTKNPELRNNSTFILLDKVTKIGRNPELVDVVLNSIMHSNMISRDHSELVGELDENQRYKYSICDKSLNGTYVNDTRVTGAVLLQEGDIIKFGHVNGAAIKPGEYAPQQTAEFIFRFERAIPGHKYFGYTIKGIRLHPEKTRAYMQISSDRVAPHEAFPATVTKVLPQATIASANATVAAVVSLPASTSTPLSCSSTSTTSGLNSLMSGLSSNSLQTNHHPGLMQQHQHAAAASALAAAANLSADDVAAVSAHLRTVAAADALNSWNSSLYQLTRLHQQNPHLYGSAFPAAAAAAAAYFQGAAGAPAAALWPNVAQWRAALGQGAATASNTPTDWVQFNQQKAAVAAAYGLANSSANSLQQLRLPYSQPLQQNTSGLPAPMPLGPQVTSNANCLPTSSNSGFMPQILSPCAIGVVDSSASGGYGGVITSANATSSMGSSMYSTSFGCSTTAPNSNSAYSSCTSGAGPMKPAQQYQPQQQESPSISAKLAAAAASATKEELEAATRAAAAWPSIPPCSSASSTSARTQLPPSLASVLPAALAARQAGVPLSYMANPSSLSIGQRIPIATALAAVSNNTMNGGPVPTSVNNQNTPTSKLPSPATSQQLDWRSSAAAAAFLGNEERRLLSSPSTATNLGTPPPLPIKLEQRSRNSSTSLSSISSHSTFTNRGPTNNLAQSPNQPEVSTEDLMSKASCSSVTEPTPTATTINSLAAAIFDHEGGVGASKGGRKVAQVAPLTPQKPPANKKSLKRTKTADLDLAKGELNGGDELKQLQLATAQAASLASEVLERPAFVRTPDAAGEEVLPPSSIVVKMMECDSSVPSPPKLGLLGNLGTTGHNGQHNNENASDSVASNPSRPCSYQSSIPLSPPRAPCPQTRKSPESVSRSPLPAPKKYCSSNDSRSSWIKQEEKEDLASRVSKKKKKKEAKNNNQDDENDEEEEEDESGKGEKPKPIKQTRKSNEVARLLNDLTAGNCSWQHQAERTIRTSSKHCNGDSAQPDLPNGHLLGSADRKKRTLRLEERKLKEMQKKKQHKMMRQISDESSADSDADNSQKKQLASISSVKLSSASSNDSDSETSSVKNHRSNLLSSAPTPIKSKRLAAINGTDSTTPVFKSDLLVEQRLTSMDTNELKNSVGGNISSNSTKSSKTSTQEKRRMLKESVKEENISKSSSRSKSKSNSISSSISKKSDKLSTSSSRPPKRKSSSKPRKKGSDSDSDSDTNSLTGYTESQSTVAMKPPASKRSNGSNGSGSKNNSLNTSSSSIKKRNGGASKVSFSAKEKGQKSKEGMDGDEWFLYHDPDRDLCAHKACQRPQQLSINWVQCDDCDSWYHSLCALGTNTELEGDADFHCGCTLKKK